MILVGSDANPENIQEVILTGMEQVAASQAGLQAVGSITGDQGGVVTQPEPFYTSSADTTSMNILQVRVHSVGGVRFIIVMHMYACSVEPLLMDTPK